MRRYPIAKLLRFTPAQWKAMHKHCKAKDIPFTQWVRETLAREVVLSRK